MGDYRPVKYTSCSTPNRYTFAFDGSSAAATHTVPPVSSCRSDFNGWCDCSVYLFPNGILARPCSVSVRVVVAEVLTAEDLFSRQSYLILYGLFKFTKLFFKKEELSDECEKIQKLLTNISLICYNDIAYKSHPLKVFREFQLSSDRLCVCAHTRTQVRVFLFTHLLL